MAIPWDDVPHRFFTLSGDWQADLEEGAAVVQRWLPQVAALPRTPESLAHLNIALQCGGSDAFSGVSGNPLASAIAKEIIGYGGRANGRDGRTDRRGSVYAAKHARFDDGTRLS